MDNTDCLAILARGVSAARPTYGFQSSCGFSAACFPWRSLRHLCFHVHGHLGICHQSGLSTQCRRKYSSGILWWVQHLLENHRIRLSVMPFATNSHLHSVLPAASPLADCRLRSPHHANQKRTIPSPCEDHLSCSAWSTVTGMLACCMAKVLMLAPHIASHHDSRPTGMRSVLSCILSSWKSFCCIQALRPCRHADLAHSSLSRGLPGGA